MTKKTKIQINKAFEDNADSKELLNSDKLEQMSLEIKEICELLNKKNKQFDCNDAFTKIIKYVQQYDRLLYGDISSYCFALTQEEMDNFNGNLIRMVIFTDSKDFSNTIEKIKENGIPQGADLCDKAKRIVLKIYDHVNLASAQINDLKKDDKDIEMKIDNQLQPVKSDIIKEMSGQLLSLVAIFTAVAFVVFGGFSSLSSIFSNINENPEKLIMVVSIWGIAICNVIYILMYSIGHLLKLNQPTDKTASLIPINLVKWTNLILCSIGAIAAWLYFLDVNKVSLWFVKYSQTNSKSVSIIGIVVIIAIAIILGIIMFIKNPKDKPE